MVTIQRTTKNYSNEESFKLYQGEGTSGTLKYIQPSVYDNGIFRWNICLTKSFHYTVEMSDSSGNGWSDGSSVSFLWNDITIGTVTLDGGSVDTYSLTFPSYIPSSIMWNYSNTPQIGTLWTESSSIWETPTVYPAISSITRYFRYTYTCTDVSSYGIRFTLTTKHGFRVYLNGKVVYDYGLPDGEVTSSTYGIGVSEKAMPHVYSTMISLFPPGVNNQFVFAVELHAPINGVSGDESFEMSILFMNDASISLMDNSSTIVYYPSDFFHYLNSDDNGLKVFDGSLSTEWRVKIESNELPAWITYTYPNDKRELMNKYEISSVIDSTYCDCTSWKIYGSNDSTDWSLLDIQSDVSWKDGYDRKSYSIHNNISYNGFKWECTGISTSCSGSLHLSEVKFLMYNQSNSVGIDSSPVLPVGLDDNNDMMNPSIEKNAINRAINDYPTRNHVIRSHSFNVFANPTSCSSGKTLVTLERVTKSYAYEESFKIYEG